MHEYVTPAFVLDFEESGDYDARIFLFTEKLGRITARAKSIRAAHSKLAGHLQPMMLSTVRLVEKHGFQVVDSIMSRNLARDLEPKKVRELVEASRLIRQMTQEREPEPALWSLIESSDILSKKFLKVMGFDPEHATCAQCEAAGPSSFVLKDALYLCKNCLTSHHREMYVQVAA